MFVYASHRKWTKSVSFATFWIDENLIFVIRVKYIFKKILSWSKKMALSKQVSMLYT